ncbi:MAG: dockerin type I repeat-containing protein [Planctomycetota bacterium]
MRIAMAARSAWIVLFALGLVPSAATPIVAQPVTLLNCNPAATGVTLTWTNNGAFDEICLFVDGNLVGELPGAATTATVPPLLPGPHVLCVLPKVVGANLQPSCCQVGIPGGMPSTVTDLVCEVLVGSGDIDLSWVNQAAYSDICVYIDGVLVAVLPGPTTSTTVTVGASGGHVICVEPKVGGVPRPPVCCQVFVPGPGTAITGLACDPLGGTANVAVAWTNNAPYDSICISVDGVVVAVLPGSDNFFTVTGLTPGPHEICVEAKIGGVSLPLVCCQVMVPPHPVANLACDPLGGSQDVAVAWNNTGAYDSICVYVDGVLVDVLPGGANFTTVMGLAPGAHEICVEPKLGGVPQPPRCCQVQIPGPDPITMLGCDPLGGTLDVAVAWTNGGAYTSLCITVDGVLVATLAGAASGIVLPVGPGNHLICVEAKAGPITLPPVCCQVAVGGGGQELIRGDCNADGTVNVADAVRILSFLFGGAVAPPCADACDCNDDGVVNIADAIAKLGFLFGAGAPPPAPSPNCGLDPTADALGCGSFPPCP